MADKIKIALAMMLAVGGIAAFYYLAQSPTVVRVAAVLLGFAAAAFVMWTSDPGKQFHEYAQESVAETRKVVWPTRKETLQTTGIVFAFVLVMALFLWAVDSVLLWIVRRLLATE
jgi:preprotein translocase subunit SecE